MDLTFFNIGKFCASVNLSDSKPFIDLSAVKFFHPFALVYLGMFLRYFNAQGKRFQLLPPENTLARDYLARQNFWERFNFNERTIQKEKLRRFTTATSLNDIADIETHMYIAEEVSERVADVLNRTAASLPIYSVQEIVAELVQNFVEHSERALAAFMVQYYPRKRLFRIAVGDCGVGIRAKLSSVSEYEWVGNLSHADAAMKAFEVKVSSKKGGGGTGFYQILDGVLSLGGALYLATGDEYVVVRGKTFDDCLYRKGKTGFDFTGVQVELVLPERREPWNA